MTRKNLTSSESSESDSSIHGNTSSSTIDMFKGRASTNSKWSFQAPISSRSLPRNHHSTSEYVNFDYTGKGIPFISSCSSGSSDHFAYPSRRSSSIDTCGQAGFTAEQDYLSRSQRDMRHGSHSACIASTEVTYPTAQEAPAPLFDPFILIDPEKEPRSYHLIIRQSPMHGLMCTLGSRKRRILDPLPVVQLVARDQNGKRFRLGQTSLLLIMQVNLIVEQIEVGSGDENSAKNFERNESGSPGNSIVEMPQYVPPTPAPNGSSSTNSNGVGVSGFASVDKSTMIPIETLAKLGSNSKVSPKRCETHPSALRLLEGKLTASPHFVKNIEDHLGVRERAGSVSQSCQSREKDIHQSVPIRRSSVPVPSATSNALEAGGEIQAGQEACVFIFTDLSIRLRGTYRLEFSLIRLGSLPSMKKLAGEIVARTISEPFPVHQARDFAGMTESTLLAKTLASQGVQIPIKNGSRRNEDLSPPHQPQQQTTTNEIKKGRKVKSKRIVKQLQLSRQHVLAAHHNPTSRM